MSVACGDDDDTEPAEGDPPTAVEESAPEEPQEPVAPEREAVPEPRPQLALGATHGCELQAQGSVRCWGSHRFGQLGAASPVPGPAATRVVPVVVGGLSDAVRIAAGSFHTCALRAEGQVVCWGHGGFGQLGVAGDEDRVQPAQVALDEPAVEIAAGEGHTCARLATRRVACWGRNTFGQLGDETEGGRHEALVVDGVEDAVGIALGRDHSCALIDGGEVRCWGAGFEGQLGDGERSERRHTPRAVPGLEPARELVSGSGHVCVILSEGGAVSCWGRNDSGQVGDGEGGDPADVTLSPARVAGMGDVVELGAGARFTCARREDGEVLCWGYNGFGQLGDGTEDARPGPTAVAELPDATELAAGARHACARIADGTLRCWGRNHLGQVGREPGDPELSPVPCCGIDEGS